MVEISSSGSGGGPGWETAPGYPTPRRAGYLSSAIRVSQGLLPLSDVRRNNAATLR